MICSRFRGLFDLFKIFIDPLCEPGGFMDFLESEHRTPGKLLFDVGGFEPA